MSPVNSISRFRERVPFGLHAHVKLPFDHVVFLGISAHFKNRYMTDWCHGKKKRSQPLANMYMYIIQYVL